ncbi:MAG: deoxyribose-phosphate aldolase [Cyanobacteria bacterium P01_A01_bin.17]
MKTDPINLALYIDHTLLDPLARPEQIVQFCEQAERFAFPTVCVYPVHVKQAVDLLHRKSPQVSTVIGFPSGATTSRVKLYEAQEAVDNGATELDVVINLGWLKAGNIDAVHREIADICAATGQTVKAILEMTVLTEAEKRLAAEACADAGASFLKTSTGWNGGATVADVKLLKEVGCDRIGIKASGGIRTFEQAIALIQAGATRLGTSRGLDLIQQQAESLT